MAEDTANHSVPLGEPGDGLVVAMPAFGLSAPGNAAYGLPRLLVVAFIVLVAVLAGRLGAGRIAELDALVAEAAAADTPAVANSHSSARGRPQALEKPRRRDPVDAGAAVGIATHAPIR